MPEKSSFTLSRSISNGADFGVIVGLGERVDASMGDAVPELDVAIFRAGGVEFPVKSVFDVGLI